jgi:AraC family transcriptional regulator
MKQRTVKDDTILKADKVISNYLFRSDFYEIKDWAFDFAQENKSSTGYNDCLCVVLVKTGNFLFDLSKHTYDMHTGHVLIDKPDYEYKLRPATGNCTILNFSNDFYASLIDDLNLRYSFFFSNPSILSLVLKATPEIEYLHHQLLKNTQGGKLEMDNMIIELLKLIVNTITENRCDFELNNALKRYHLTTVEKAKQFMTENFGKDISLFEISSYACVSPFHFSRIFKQLTSYTPYHYLLTIRLKHGEMLLKNSLLPVADISVAAGFKSAEYFATCFRQKYGASPTEYRKLIV